MPNFGDARNTLAKEASWEPEEPEESEDERELRTPRQRPSADNQDVIDFCWSASPTSNNSNADYADVLQHSESQEFMLNWISLDRSLGDFKLVLEEHCAVAHYSQSTRNDYNSTAGRPRYKLPPKPILLDDNGKPKSKVSDGQSESQLAFKLRLGVC
jgi:hypothetical protein